MTTAFAAAHGDRLRVASHTAGGVRPDGSPIDAAPAVTQAGLIRTPYQWHHGSDDEVVPLALDQLFEAALDASGVAHDGHVYAGAMHDISQLPEALDRIHAWYAAHGMF